MPNPEIEEFARILVHQIRDAAVRNCDSLLRPDARSPVAMRWQDADKQGALPQAMIPDAIDETVFSLLQAIDQGILRVKFVTSTGKEVDLTQEGLGELSGWYMGSGGWRAMYSQERFVDDFADLD
ncbi:hypothetical protein [Sorangium cellulosum]|uniref:hypothetical protein n=1 Tax=Sorangium cellulosum TaxID=56 RepID=UPI0011DD31F6|nr:hypothetical protein [Sorangium cellulosum]